MGQVFTTPGNFAGYTNGTTAVPICSPGASSSFTPNSIRVYNADTGNITAYLQFVDSSVPITITIASSGVLAPGQYFQFCPDLGRDVLISTTQSFQIVLAGAKTSVDATILASWGIYS